MIYLYSGTPGSGKSLHMARMIFLLLKHSDCLVIGNFYIKKQYFTEDEYYIRKLLLPMLLHLHTKML